MTHAEFGRELKAWLRRGPSRDVKVGALAKRLGISQSTLYAYLAGTTLPPTDVLDDLLYAIGVPAQEHRRLATTRDTLERQRRKGTDPPDAPTHVIPHELPADPKDFIGRTTELDMLDHALHTAQEGGPSVAVLSGTAGVGKTALAVHWGQRVTSQFPDGCLYVDLLGFAPGEPRQPADVIAAFLRSLGARDADIPHDAHERENRLRTALTHRSVLIVLDNALDVAQVRPLLPAESCCFVIVTSRQQLDGLQVKPGAHRVPVPPLQTEIAIELLRSHMPRRITTAPPPAAHTLAERCGGLPLALRVVGAYASAYPDQPLQDLVDELGAGLDVFDVGDDATSVRAVFSWSERRLSLRAAETYYLLGLSPLSVLDVRAVTALVGADERTTRRRIDELVRAHLLQRSPTGKLSMHDLVREHAREQAANVLSDGERDAALDRLLEHLTAAATEAVALLHPWDDDESHPDRTGIKFRGRRDAQRWLDAEWDDLMTAIRFAAESDRPEQTVRLVTALRRHLDQSGRHLEALTVMTIGRDAARRTGDRVTEATAIRDLGAACLRLGRYEQAMDHYRAVLTLTREAGDRAGEAGTLNNLGNVHERLGDFQRALDNYDRALPLARELGIEGGEATLLLNIGVAHVRLGAYDQAMDDSRAALAIFERLGDAGGAARALGNLGDIHRSAGEYAEAHERLDEGLARAREVGAVAIETEILNALGATKLATGSPDEARRCHEAALSSSREMADRFEEARALEGLSRVCTECDEPEEARTTWNAAAAIYDALGVPPLDADPT